MMRETIVKHQSVPTHKVQERMILSPITAHLLAELFPADLWARIWTAQINGRASGPNPPVESHGAAPYFQRMAVFLSGVTFPDYLYKQAWIPSVHVKLYNSIVQDLYKWDEKEVRMAPV